MKKKEFANRWYFWIEMSCVFFFDPSRCYLNILQELNLYYVPLGFFFISVIVMVAFLTASPS